MLGGAALESSSAWVNGHVRYVCDSGEGGKEGCCFMYVFL